MPAKLGPIPWPQWMPLLESRRKYVNWTEPAIPTEYDNIVNWFDSRWLAPQQLLVSPFTAGLNRHGFPGTLDKNDYKKAFVIPGFEWLAHELAHLVCTPEQYIYDPWWGEGIMPQNEMDALEAEGSQLRRTEYMIGEHLGIYERHLNPKREEIEQLYFKVKETGYKYPPPREE